MKIVVMGVGICGAFPVSGGLSYREMIARAASMAYEDAGIEAWQLDGITGATITSEAIGKILNDSANTWVPALENELQTFATSGLKEEQ